MILIQVSGFRKLIIPNHPVVDRHVRLFDIKYLKLKMQESLIGASCFVHKFAQNIKVLLVVFDFVGEDLNSISDFIVVKSICFLQNVSY